MLPYSKIVLSLYSTVGGGNYFSFKRFDLKTQWLKNYDIIEYITKKPKEPSKTALQSNC